MQPKTLLMTAGVALAVVIAHEKIKAGGKLAPRLGN